MRIINWFKIELKDNWWWITTKKIRMQKMNINFYFSIQMWQFIREKNTILLDSWHVARYCEWKYKNFDEQIR